MPNPIHEDTRKRLYVLGVTIGIFGVVAGPLMVALNVPDVWTAVVISFLGAVATATNVLARANVDPPGTSEPVTIEEPFEAINLEEPRHAAD